MNRFPAGATVLAVIVLFVAACGEKEKPEAKETSPQRPLEGVIVVYEVRFRAANDPGSAIDEAIHFLRERIAERKLAWTVEKAGWNQIGIAAPATYGDEASISAATGAIADLVEQPKISFRIAATTSLPQGQTNAHLLTTERARDLIADFREDRSLRVANGNWRWVPVPAAREVLGLEDVAEGGVTEALAFRGLVGFEEAGQVYLLLSDRPDSSMTSGDGWNIRKASATRNDWGGPAMHVELDQPGGARMKAITASHRHHQMAIVVNDRVVMVAMIQSEIGDQIVVTGKDVDVPALVRRLGQESNQAPVEFVTPPETVTSYRSGLVHN